MRLLTKTTLYFLLAMVPLLLAGGSLLFRQFGKEINKNLDDELLNEEVQWIQNLRSETENGTTFILRTPELAVYPVDAPPEQYPTIRDSYGRGNNAQALYRQLSHAVYINGITYQIMIRKSQEQKLAMKANVTHIMLLVFAGLLVSTLLFNWLISRRLWEPFKRSLQKIREAELHKMEAVHFEQTNIEEFNELNASLNSMTAKIYSDYVSMKEFTENAAHEMQTPLAIVQSKMELLLQDVNLADSQVELIMQASTALNRLSKLNQSLLLLAKIENNQYETAEKIGLTGIIDKYLLLFAEVIKDRRVTITTDYTDDFVVSLHPLLADLLVSNLLGNAVKYNHPGGEVHIQINQNAFIISNTSQLPAIEPAQLFKRFNKSSSVSDTSNGLGLAIIKKICDMHHLQIDYSGAEGRHTFKVTKDE